MLLLRRLIGATLITGLALAALPYLGVFSAPDFIGPFPQALAITLAVNVVLTACVIALYPVCFRPLQRKIDAHPVEEI